MTTINISLPERQARLIDALVEKFGFANRSEFIRSVIRLITAEEKVLKEVITYPFASPKIKSRKKILAEFKKTGKYSSLFLKDLEEGLKNSAYFKP